MRWMENVPKVCVCMYTMYEKTQRKRGIINGVSSRNTHTVCPVRSSIYLVTCDTCACIPYVCMCSCMYGYVLRCKIAFSLLYYILLVAERMEMVLAYGSLWLQLTGCSRSSPAPLSCPSVLLGYICQQCHRL